MKLPRVRFTVRRMMLAVLFCGMECCLAIDLWEPRFRVISIALPDSINSPTQLRKGGLGIEITGIYYPYALEGDFTPDPAPRTVRHGRCRIASQTPYWR